MATRRDLSNRATGHSVPAGQEKKRSVRVRMYRQGLGDCFLLTFRQSTGPDTHVVIDCGVLTGSPDGANRLRKAVQNIKQETGGKVDLLVATHEHADHLSGFNQARAIWDAAGDEIQVTKTWLAWTEQLTSPAVTSLKNRMATRLKAVLGGMDKLTKVAQVQRSFGLDTQANILDAGATTLRGLLDFALDEDDDPAILLEAPLADAPRTGPARALEWLKERAGKDLEYCRPTDEPRSLPQREDIKVFVLGPPDGPLLRYQNPDRPGEGYLGPSRSECDVCFGLAVANAKAFGQTDPDAATPFDQYYQIPFAEIQSASPSDDRAEFIPFFTEHYGFDHEHPDSYRRIEHDWLNLAESMALSQINYVNNTSLVLAFELVEGGPVLLFPGDAQIGSWQSWKDLAWEFGNGAHQRKVTGPELLEQVVFYKVGHHGSHNATLKEGGLELMTNPELVAFIPVHQKTAQRHSPPWIMPWGRLRDALNSNNAFGRVILSDQDESEQKQTALPDSATDSASARRWSDFTRALKWDPSDDQLWVDYEYHY